ncbi:MAG TPA: hypothetical protein VHQ86_06180 [Candidatus Saccharimonadia bacterium]|nr:hypothetical protein [Candidatus Saccharimonadia bacterium]
MQQAAAIERRRRETELAAWTWSLTDPRTEVGVTEAKGAARAQARLGTVEADAEALVLQVIDELSTADLYVERDGNGAISTVALL